ncbi:MAG: hypothetical protein ACO1OB_00600 [Archangium sp.]
MSLLLALCACGRTARVDAGVVSPDAAVVLRHDAGSSSTCAPFGVDCCRNGTRVTSASCVNGVDVCSEGEPCSCGDVAQSFNCVDFCGTDAFTGPACVNGAWRCASGLKPSSECPAGTCWGAPGDCCQDARCEDGAWVCAAIEC